MKILKVSILFTFVTIFIFGLNQTLVVQAEDSGTSDEVILPTPKAGISPDSRLYKIDIWLEKIQLLLIRDKDEKVEKLVEFSQEKLAEIIQMKTEENEDGLETAASRYLELVKNANKLFVELAKEDKSGTEDLAELVAASNSKGQDLIMDVYEDTDEVSHPVLEEALKENARGIEDAVDYTSEENKEVVRERVKELFKERAKNVDLERYTPNFLRSEREKN